MIHRTVTIALLSKGLFFFMSNFLVTMCCCVLRQDCVSTLFRARIPPGMCLVRFEAQGPIIETGGRGPGYVAACS